VKIVGRIAFTVLVHMSQNNNFMTTSNKTLGQLVNMTLNSAHIGVEKVSYHADIVAYHDGLITVLINHRDKCMIELFMDEVIIFCFKAHTVNVMFIDLNESSQMNLDLITFHMIFNLGLII